MKLAGKCYRSIEDMPIHNWMKLITGGDLSYMLIDKRRISKAERKALEARWEKLYDQYIAAFGFSDTFLQILEIKKDIALLQIEQAEMENTSIKTIINVRKAELERMQTQTGGSNFYETKTQMETRIGFQIDAKKMSVMEFYKTLKTLEKKPGKQRQQ